MNGRARVTVDGAHGARDIAEAVLVSSAVRAERCGKVRPAHEND